MLGGALLAVALLTAGHGGIELKIDAETRTVDPAKSVYLTLTLTSPKDVNARLPDLRDRVRGFSLVEDFEEEPTVGTDGSKTQKVNWKLVPEPCAETYKIAPFVVHASPRLLSRQSDDGALSFVAGPVYFDPPAARPAAAGDMECDPEKDLPPLSWALVGWVALALLAVAAAVTGCVFLVRYAVRRVREHRMSPIERAWVELDRLMRRGLPGRGRYKDFYVELTMVVRRYVQRQYGIRAPHLTTEEFLRELQGSAAGRRSRGLAEFLESADMVKFAGVKATPEMADGATASARGYLEEDQRQRAAEGVRQ